MDIEIVASCATALFTGILAYMQGYLNLSCGMHSECHLDKSSGLYRCTVVLTPGMKGTYFSGVEVQFGDVWDCPGESVGNYTYKPTPGALERHGGVFLFNEPKQLTFFIKAERMPRIKLKKRGIVTGSCTVLVQ